MTVVARIAGVHPVEATEPCHLCELVIEGEVQDIDFGQITQPVAGRDQSCWQVAYDERLVSSGSDRTAYAFFFHHLDLAEPLQSPFGPLPLPKPSPRPARLDFVEYERP